MKTQDNVKIIKLIQSYCPKEITQQVLDILIKEQKEKKQ
jgi:hypothetical protein